MLAELKELWKFRELLLTMVQRDLKIRYKNSVLGIVWSLLNPLVTVFVMSFVIGNFLKPGVPNFGAYMLAAYLPFMFFQFCILDSAQSVLLSIQLVKKIYFPREILPLAAVLSNLVHFFLAYTVFFAYLLVVWVCTRGEFPIRATVVWVPVLLLINIAFATGLSLIVCALNTFYEDVKYIVSIGLYLLFFLTPVMYFSEDVANSKINHDWGGKFYQLYNLNPLAILSESYRKAILSKSDQLATNLPFDWRYLLVSAVISFATLYFGYAMFNRLKWKFVERP
jgi:ABC-type polysaccharide/polyol phosphate export permease